MSTIIFNIVIILCIIIAGGYILFVLGSLIFANRENKEEKKEDVDVDCEIKILEARQRVIYNRLLELEREELKKQEAVLEKTEEVEEKQEIIEEPNTENVDLEEETLSVDEEQVEETEKEVIEETESIDEDQSVEVEGAPVVENKKKIPSKRRSFALKLSSSTQSTKKYFSEVTNKLRQFGLTARIGKSKVMFRANKEVYAKMVFKGKRIVLCLPLDPNDPKYDIAVYKQIDYSNKKGFETLPFGIKLLNKKMMDLVDGLIQEVIAKFNFEENPKFKPIDYVEKYPDIYTEFEKNGYGYLLKTEVLKEDVEKYDDRFAEKIILEQKLEDKQPKRLIKAEIRIEEFNNRYTDTTIPVNLERLKASDLIGKNVNYLIIKASSRIDKPFVVIANEFEPDAVKMICMVGGKAIKTTYSEVE